MIDLYTKAPCGYCVSAKTLLETRGIEFREHKFGIDFDRDFIINNFPGVQTFPVVVSNGVLIGGYEQLRGQIMEQGSSFGKTFLRD